jgi:hypothetical protein
MKLDEAKKILKENNYMLLNETTAISAPETILGMCILKALEQYKNKVREQIKEGEETGDEDDVKAGNLWLSKIEKAEETLEEEDYGSAILKLLGIDEFNPYYP